LICKDPPQLITQQAQLLELLNHLRAVGSFAYDSEFIGELTYVPKLCLVQTATPDRVALIDPLAELNLTPFWELIADQSVEKIVHAGQQDVEPVFRLLNRPPANLFDTQISAGFIGLGHPLSLSKLVYAMVGAKLTKGLTFTHWDRRPLSALQLRYAADDVRYLPAIRHKLREALEKRGHVRWAAEESASLADPSLYVFDPESQFLRIRGAGNLSPQNLAVLRELTIFRNDAAQLEDVPPRAFLKDEILVDMARSPIRSLESLARVRGLPRPVESAHGQKIVDATARALAMKPQQWPSLRAEESSPREKFAADSLWAAVQGLCAGRDIDPTLVTGRQEIGELYRLTLAGQDASPLSLLKGWRREAIGEVLLSFLAGHTRLNSYWRDGSLRSDVELK
jgi:ribonuclease D